MSMSEVIDIVQRKLEGSKFDVFEIEDAVKEAEFQIRNFTGRWQTKNIVDTVTGTVIDTEIEELPRPLNYVWASIAIDIVNLGGTTAAQSAATVDPGAVKSIKEGDTTIEFVGASGGSTSAAKSSSTTLLMGDYASQLYPYRRLYPGVGEVDGYR